MLILSLPTHHSTVRMRAWRALKACGAAVLRDGVYLLPAGERHFRTLNTIARVVREGEGTAYLLTVECAEEEEYQALFDRTEAYAEILSNATALRERLSPATLTEVRKQVRKLRKSFGQLVEIDFFPGPSQRQLDITLQELEQAISQVQDPDEPKRATGSFSLLQVADFQGRLWATRRRPRIDRLASAWLITRFIDKEARFLWLNRPEDCPPEALGFDFDGATFTHLGERVTFEVLMASFSLVHPGLTRIGALVHYLDVGGVQPPEAAGIEALLNGLRDTIPDDDQLLAQASAVFDGLLSAFTPEAERS